VVVVVLWDALAASVVYKEAFWPRNCEEGFQGVFACDEVSAPWRASQFNLLTQKAIHEILFRVACEQATHECVGCISDNGSSNWPYQK